MTSLSDAHATGTEAGDKSFTYDANGDMTSDGRKGLDLTWNVLNLVDSAAMHGSSLKYAWLSEGTKVSARANDGSGDGVQKRYLGSFVYTSSGGHSTDTPTEVESIAWDEGRILMNPPAAMDTVTVIETPEGGEIIVDTVAVDSIAVVSLYRDCWFAGDHLGNVRSVIDISPDLATPEILEQNDYLPFGTRIQNPAFVTSPDNRWRYAGKEEQRFGFLDLSLLDFGARMYDPFTARWTAVDPMAKQYVGYSPFIYCVGNPTGTIDPNGSSIKPIKTVFKVARKAYKAAKNSEKFRLGLALTEEAYSLVDDAKTLTDPESTAFQKGLAVFDLATGFGEEAKIGLKALGVSESTFKLTSRGTLKRRMKNALEEGMSIEGKHAHHMLPWEHRNFFTDAGIDINDPKYGV